MGLEQKFAQDLIRKYEKEGWKAMETSEAKAELGFEPDLFFRRADQNLVIEIKKEGAGASRALSLIRKIVETKPGWKFEIKFVPVDYNPQIEPLSERWLTDRVEVADKLWSSGSYPEAFVLAWTAIEAVLRIMVFGSGDQGVTSIPMLLRRSYEEGNIEEGDLRQLEKAVRLRSQIVHGYHVGDVKNESRELIRLAKKFTGTGNLKTRS